MVSKLSHLQNFPYFFLHFYKAMASIFNFVVLKQLKKYFKYFDYSVNANALFEYHN